MHKPLIGLSAVSFALASFVAGADVALACGAFDVACEVTETIQNPGRKIQQGGQNLQRTFDQGRTDLSNGLNRIDPRITQAGRDIDAARLRFQSEVFTGPALEQWIIQSRNDAIRGAAPMPPNMRAALRGWYSEQLLSVPRYKIGDGGALNLANASLSYGDAQAITLIDVIVFKDGNAADDPSIWAHEMKHIQQYSDWGVHSFAVQYMRSWNSVENPAYEIQNRFAQAWNSGGGFQSAAAPQAPPPQIGRVCIVGPYPNQRCLINPMPMGSNCSCSDGYRAWYGMAGN